MAYVILLNLQIILIFAYFVIKCFKKILMHRLIISIIVVYHTTIISNILNKKVDYIKLRIINS